MEAAKSGVLSARARSAQEIVAYRRSPALIGVLMVFTGGAELDPPAVGTLEPRDQPQQGGLP